MSWELTGNNGTNPNGQNGNFLGTTDSQPLVVKTNNSEAMRISADGHVIIGTVIETDLSTKLQVSEGHIGVLGVSDTFDQTLYLYNNVGKELRLTVGANSGGTAWYTQANTGTLGVGSGMDLRFSAGAAEAMRIVANGSVGIGTTTPDSKLEVIGKLTVNNDQDVAIRATSVASGGVVGISQNEVGVTGISTTSIGVFATSTTGTCIKAYSGQYTEEPQVLIEADNTQPGAFARLRIEQTNTDARWDIAVGGATNVMNFDDINFGRTILSLSTNGDATLSGSLLQHSSRALKDQIHDLACEEAVDALQLLNPVKFTLKSDKEARRRLGFISEEVPDLVASPDRATVSPMDIIAVLTKVAQAQQQTITALTHKVNDLQRRLA